MQFQKFAILEFFSPWLFTKIYCLGRTEASLFSLFRPLISHTMSLFSFYCSLVFTYYLSSLFLSPLFKFRASHLKRHFDFCDPLASYFILSLPFSFHTISSPLFLFSNFQILFLWKFQLAFWPDICAKSSNLLPFPLISAVFQFHPFQVIRKSVLILGFNLKRFI